MDISPDAMFLTTLSSVEGDEPQSISLWEWTVEREEALYTSEVAASDLQTCVRFNTNDIREIVTSGKQRVIFWNWEQRKFKYYSPPLSQRDFKQAVGAFTQSMFVPASESAVTATEDGDVVVWEQSLVGQTDAYSRATDKRAVKVIKLSTGPIWFMAAVENLLVLGSDDGAVRFYDHQFRAVAWFEDLDAGPVTAVSFANTSPPAPSPSDPSQLFAVPDFVVGSSKAFVVGVEPYVFNETAAENRRGTLLVQGMDDEVHGLAAHPFMPQLAVSGYSGALQLWDYEEKRLLMVRVFDTAKLRPHCLAFDPHGRFLAVGFTNGVIKVLDGGRLDDVLTCRPGDSCVVELAFSHDSQYMATADAGMFVALWRYMVHEDALQAAQDSGRQPSPEWVYLGRYKSHALPITGLAFGVSAEGGPLLASVGEDRMLVEYALERCSVGRGVQLSGPAGKTEQAGTPTACLWQPVVRSEAEDLLITASDEYKLKLWNANNKTCRRTVLGPTYGGPINKLLLLPPRNQDESSGFIAYATAEKVVGLMQLPLDGNPNKAMGLIAHPGAVSNLCCTHDGRFLVTAGGADLTVNLWAVDTDALELTAAAGGTGVEPFVNLIEGGLTGEFYQEIVDYFYYSQLRSQGEDSTQRRRATGRVPLQEIPNLMRALGFYPSEQELQNMCSEVKYGRFTATGDTQESIDLDGFIQLYTNHRPVFGVGKANIQQAFDVLGASRATGHISWAALQHKLQTMGEQISEFDLRTCLQALLGDEMVEGKVTADSFATEILGFEDYEQQGVGDEEGAMAAAEGSTVFGETGNSF